jgi:hypothetical protein
MAISDIGCHLVERFCAVPWISTIDYRRVEELSIAGHRTNGWNEGAPVKGMVHERGGRDSNRARNGEGPRGHANRWGREPDGPPGGGGGYPPPPPQGGGYGKVIRLFSHSLFCDSAMSGWEGNHS